jgi:hypothetical protein
MNTKELFVFCATVLAATFGGGAVAQQANEQYVQVAEIENRPGAAGGIQGCGTGAIEAAIRVEPGVLVLYAVSDKTLLLASRSSRFIATWMPIARISHPNISRNTRLQRRRWSVAQARATRAHHAGREIEIVARGSPAGDNDENFIRAASALWPAIGIGGFGVNSIHRAGEASRLYDRRQHCQGPRDLRRSLLRSPVRVLELMADDISGEEAGCRLT